MNDQERSIETYGMASLSQHCFGSSDVERAMAGDPSVAEVVVVPNTLHLGGQALSAFITLREGVAESEELKTALTHRVQEEIGPFGIPEKFYFGPSLPRTRSGRIMRDIIQEMAENKLCTREFDAAGQPGRAAIRLLQARQNHPMMKGPIV
jgi:acyl-coenzyme A synthetase/AMP-(fatty) acid ligase